MSASSVSPAEIYSARRRLRKHLAPTPLRESVWLSSLKKATIALKLESLQLTSSFKVRGAFNAAIGLASGEKRPAIVTASAGNHGRAMALAGERLGLPTVVFVPAAAPATKKAAIRHHHADLREAPDYDTAEQLAREHAATTAAVYVSPYNHTDVIAGAGTIGLELLDSMPAVDAVIVPVGGGGLISGLAIAMKSARPDTEVIGVEVDASRPFSTSLAAGAITGVTVGPSLADGLIGNLEPGSITFALVRRHVDRLVSVSEDDLARAMQGLAGEEHLIAEGAGAAATAAVLFKDVIAPGQRAAVLVTGGNVDLSTLRQILGA
jgi:threonine dehydratase